MAQIMFEVFNTPAVYVAIQASTLLVVLLVLFWILVMASHTLSPFTKAIAFLTRSTVSISLAAILLITL